MTVADYGVIRWLFEDLETGDWVRVPLNPKTWTKPTSSRQMQWWVGGDAKTQGESRIRGIDQGQTGPAEWTFGGSIYTKEHYDLLLAWSERASVLRITDHLERAFEVVITNFDVVEKQRSKPDPELAWRSTYTMTCLILKEPT